MKTNVEKKYVDVADELSKKIKLNINAQVTYDLLVKYPPREYPVEEVIDPKKKSKTICYDLDVKKDVKPPPKKKKKEPPFPMPEWAKELKVVLEKYNELKGYINMSKEIGLDDTFVVQTKTVLQRFDKEIRFRKNEEEVLRKLEEEKAKKNKKKK
jgi:hypothetical protein